MLITGDKTSVHITMGVLSYYGSLRWDDPMFIKGVNPKVLFITIRITIRIENTYQAGAELLEVPPKS